MLNPTVTILPAILSAGPNTSNRKEENSAIMSIPSSLKELYATLHKRGKFFL